MQFLYTWTKIFIVNMDWVTNSVRKIFSSKDNPEQSSTEIERENNDGLKNPNATNSTMGEATNTNHMNVCGNSNKMKSVKQSIINARGLSEDCKPTKKRKREAEDDSDCCNKKIKAPEVTQTISSSEGSASNTIAIGDKKEKHVQIKNVYKAGVAAGNECSFGNDNTIRDVNVVNCGEYVQNKHVLKSAEDDKKGVVFQKIGNFVTENQNVSVGDVDIGGSVENDTTDLRRREYRDILNFDTKNSTTKKHTIKVENIGIGNETRQVDAQNRQVPIPQRDETYENLLNFKSKGCDVIVRGLSIGCKKTITRKQPMQK